MEKKAFTLLHDAESSWWYQGRQQAIRRVLSLLKDTAEKRMILDVGAGFGGMYDTLRAYGNVYGMEPNREARSIAESRGYTKVFSSLEEIKREGLQFDLIGAFDVIEHASEDADFLSQLHGLLRSEGNLIATVPAYPFLWSSHDVLHHHYRRYTKRTLRNLLEKQKFSVEYLGHWNMLLLPLAIISRIVGKSGEGSMAPESFLNKAFMKIVSLEIRLIPRFRLPWGVSLVTISKKVE